MIIEALAVRSTPKPDDCRAYVLTDYLFSHRPEVPLHAVNSDPEDVDEAHVLGVFASRSINARGTAKEAIGVQLKETFERLTRDDHTCLVRQ
jgi:hypothetical protein